MSEAIKSSLYNGNIVWVTKHVDLIRELPAPGIEYRFFDLVDGDVQIEGVRDDLPYNYVYHIQKLKEAGVIDPQQKVKNGSDEWTIYETNAQVWEIVTERYEYAMKMPCGHTHGFRTIDADAGEYECNYQYCQEDFDREQVEAAIA